MKLCYKSWRLIFLYHRVCCTADEHHKQTPVFSDLPQQLSQLLIRSIAINSAYTSRVLVSSCFVVILSLQFQSFRADYFNATQKFFFVFFTKCSSYIRRLYIKFMSG